MTRASTKVASWLAEPVPRNLGLIRASIVRSSGPLRPDGSPQKQRHVVRRDGTISPLLSASSRQKYRNPLKDGRVSSYLQDPDNGYRTPEVRGSVV
jgi:hypothetical protein